MKLKQSTLHHNQFYLVHHTLQNVVIYLQKRISFKSGFKLSSFLTNKI